MLGPLHVLAADLSYSPYLVGMIIGFLVGAFGHIVKSTLIITLGIAIIGATSLLFIVATNPHGLGTGRAPGPG